MSDYLPIPHDNTRALVETLVADRPFGQQTLTDLEPTLAAYAIRLTPPNARGERTKIGDPITERWTRLGFGEGGWVWIVQGDAYTRDQWPPPPADPPVVVPPPVVSPPPVVVPPPPPVVGPPPLPSGVTLDTLHADLRALDDGLRALIAVMHPILTSLIAIVKMKQQP